MTAAGPWGASHPPLRGPRRIGASLEVPSGTEREKNPPNPREARPCSRLPHASAPHGATRVNRHKRSQSRPSRASGIPPHPKDANLPGRGQGHGKSAGGSRFVTAGRSPAARNPRQHVTAGRRRTAPSQIRRIGRAGGPGGSSPRASTADFREGGQRPPNSVSCLVGEEGFEPSRPFGHTDLNRARLPFRHPPRAGSKGSTTTSAPVPRIRSDASSGRRCHGGSSTALRAAA